MIILKETKDGITTFILEACTEIIKRKFSPVNSFLKGQTYYTTTHKFEPTPASKICRSHSRVDKDFSLLGYNTMSNGSYEGFKGVQCPLHQVGDYIYQSTRQNIPADLYLHTLSSLGKHQVRK